MVYRKEVDLGGTTLSIEMGRLAKQADGAALVRLGDTVVLVAACASDQVREGIDFLPLTVDYREKFYAAGKIPGGFFSLGRCSRLKKPPGIFPAAENFSR